MAQDIGGIKVTLKADASQIQRTFDEAMSKVSKKEVPVKLVADTTDAETKLGALRDKAAETVVPIELFFKAERENMRQIRREIKEQISKQGKIPIPIDVKFTNAQGKVAKTRIEDAIGNPRIQLILTWKWGEQGPPPTSFGATVGPRPGMGGGYPAGYRQSGFGDHVRGAPTGRRQRGRRTVSPQPHSDIVSSGEIGLDELAPSMVAMPGVDPKAKDRVSDESGSNRLWSMSKLSDDDLRQLRDVRIARLSEAKTLKTMVSKVNKINQVRREILRRQLKAQGKTGKDIQTIVSAQIPAHIPLPGKSETPMGVDAEGRKLIKVTDLDSSSEAKLAEALRQLTGGEYNSMPRTPTAGETQAKETLTNVQNALGVQVLKRVSVSGTETALNKLRERPGVTVTTRDGKNWAEGAIDAIESARSQRIKGLKMSREGVISVAGTPEGQKLLADTVSTGMARVATKMHEGGAEPIIDPATGMPVQPEGLKMRYVPNRRSRMTKKGPQKEHTGTGGHWRYYAHGKQVNEAGFQAAGGIMPPVERAMEGIGGPQQVRGERWPESPYGGGYMPDDRSILLNPDFMDLPPEEQHRLLRRVNQSEQAQALRGRVPAGETMGEEIYDLLRENPEGFSLRHARQQLAEGDVGGALSTAVGARQFLARGEHLSTEAPEGVDQGEYDRMRSKAVRDINRRARELSRKKKLKDIEFTSPFDVTYVALENFVRDIRESERAVTERSEASGIAREGGDTRQFNKAVEMTIGQMGEHFPREPRQGNVEEFRSELIRMAAEHGGGPNAPPTQREAEPDDVFALRRKGWIHARADVASRFAKPGDAADAERLLHEGEMPERTRETETQESFEGRQKAWMAKLRENYDKRRKFAYSPEEQAMFEEQVGPMPTEENEPIRIVDDFAPAEIDDTDTPINRFVEAKEKGFTDDDAFDYATGSLKPGHAGLQTESRSKGWELAVNKRHKAMLEASKGRTAKGLSGEDRPAPPPTREEAAAELAMDRIGAEPGLEGVVEDARRRAAAVTPTPIRRAETSEERAERIGKKQRRWKRELNKFAKKRREAERANLPAVRAGVTESNQQIMDRLSGREPTPPEEDVMPDEGVAYDEDDEYFDEGLMPQGFMPEGAMYYGGGGGYGLDMLMGAMQMEGGGQAQPPPSAARQIAPEAEEAAKRVASLKRKLAAAKRSRAAKPEAAEAEAAPEPPAEAAPPTTPEPEAEKPKPPKSTMYAARLDILDNTLENVRLYLDREEPNVGAAKRYLDGDRDPRMRPSKKAKGKLGAITTAIEAGDIEGALKQVTEWQAEISPTASLQREGFEGTPLKPSEPPPTATPPTPAAAPRENPFADQLGVAEERVRELEAKLAAPQAAPDYSSIPSELVEHRPTDRNALAGSGLILQEQQPPQAWEPAPSEPRSAEDEAALQKELSTARGQVTRLRNRSTAWEKGQEPMGAGAPQEPEAAPPAEEASQPAAEQKPELEVGAKVINRDSRDEYEVERIRPTKAAPEGMVKLRGPAGQTVSKGRKQLEAQLGEEGGAWSYPKEPDAIRFAREQAEAATRAREEAEATAEAHAADAIASLAAKPPVEPKPAAVRTPKAPATDAEISSLEKELADAEAFAKSQIAELQAAQPDERYKVGMDATGLTYRLGDQRQNAEEFTAAGGVVSGTPPLPPTATSGSVDQPRAELRVFVTNWPASMTNTGGGGGKMGGSVFSALSDEDKAFVLQRLTSGSAEEALETAAAFPELATKDQKKKIDEADKAEAAAAAKRVAANEKAGGKAMAEPAGSAALRLSGTITQALKAGLVSEAKLNEIRGGTSLEQPKELAPLLKAEEVSRAAIQESPVRAMSVSVGQIFSSMFGGRTKMLERGQRADEASAKAKSAFTLMKDYEKAAQVTTLEMDAMSAAGEKNTKSFRNLEKQLKSQTTMFNVTKTSFEELNQKAQTLHKGVASAGDKMRSFGAATLGVMTGQLLYTGVMGVANAAITAFGDPLMKNVERMTGFKNTTNEATKALSDQVRQMGGAAEAATSLALAQTNMSESGAAMVSQSLQSRAATEAGNKAMEEQLKMVHANEELMRQNGEFGGRDKALFEATGGWFESPLMAIPATSEMIGKELGAFPRAPGELGKEGEEAEAWARALANQGTGGVAIPGWDGGMRGAMEQMEVEIPEHLLTRLDYFNAQAAKGAKGLENTSGSLQFVADKMPSKEEQAAQLNALREAGAFQIADAMEGSTLSIRDQEGGLITDPGRLEEFVYNINRGSQTPDAGLLLKQMEERTLPAMQFRIQRNLSDSLETMIPAQFAINQLTNPITPFGAGIVPMASTGQGQFSPDMGGVPGWNIEGEEKFGGVPDAAVRSFQTYQAEAQRSIDAVKAKAAEGEAALRQLGVPQSVIDNVKALSQRMQALSIEQQNLQMGLSYRQYNYQLSIARRTLGDLAGLTDRAGATELGRMQRSLQLMGRKSQILGFQTQQLGLQSAYIGEQSQALQLELGQRQINFQKAIAGFTAPGITGEERAARIREAEIEADYAQKQLDFQKEQFAIQKESNQLAREQFDLAQKMFEAQIGVQEAEQERQYGDQAAAIAQMEDAFGTNMAIAAIEATKAAIAAEREAAVAEMQEYTAAGEQLLRAEADLTAQLLEQTGDFSIELVTKVGGIFKKIADEWSRSDLGRIMGLSSGSSGYGENPELMKTEEYRSGTSTSTTRDTGSTSTNSGGRAAGFFGDVKTPTTFLAGEAGSETVAILRNARTITPMMGGGGGPTIIVSVTGNTVRNDGDLDELATRIVSKVEERLGRRTSLFGLRGSM